MAELPDTRLPIEIALETTPIPQELRPYLGYSQLGHECARYLWYSFRWCYATEISPQLQRLFNRGHQEEQVVVKDLRAIGVVCEDVLDKQAEVVGVLGHVKGHPDGRCTNIPGAEKTEHLLEIKTANDKKFNQFYRFGVERTNPAYWTQVHCYMAHQGLTRCLYIITNKNNDQRYYARIHFNKQVAEDAEGKALDIITSPVPLPKLSERAEWYECKFCNAKDICHHNTPIARNCRTCTNSSIHDNGEWHCSVYPGKPIPVDFQRAGCPDSYQPLL